MQARSFVVLNILLNVLLNVLPQKTQSSQRKTSIIDLCSPLINLPSAQLLRLRSCPYIHTNGAEITLHCSEARDETATHPVQIN